MRLWKRKSVEARVQEDGDFDIENMPVFAVERLNGRTFIGVNFGAQNQDGEWSLDVPISKHDDLVKRFRKKLNLGP
jgi:hypothetical protein